MNLNDEIINEVADLIKLSKECILDEANKFNEYAPESPKLKKILNDNSYDEIYSNMTTTIRKKYKLTRAETNTLLRMADFRRMKEEEEKRLNRRGSGEMTPEKYAKEFLVDYLESSQDEFNDNFDDVAVDFDEDFAGFASDVGDKIIQNVLKFVKTNKTNNKIGKLKRIKLNNNQQSKALEIAKKLFIAHLKDRERIDDSFENFEVNNRNVKAAINKKLKDIISFVKTIAF